MDTMAFCARMAEALCMAPEMVSPSTPLSADSWDSMAILATMAVVDEMFGVVLPGERLSRCARVQDIIDLVEEARSLAK